MKLHTLFIITLFLALFGLFITPFVSANETFTRVRGNVYNMAAGGNGIGGLTVTVTCNGVTKTAETDDFGLYVVDYSFAECNKYDFVSSSVTYNGEPQSQTVQVSDVNTATLDFYYGSVASPEFSGLTGIVATLGSGLAFLGLKRKFV